MTLPAAPALPPSPERQGDRFAARVQRSFGRHAADYEAQACLQQATAWRLGRLCGGLPLPAGPCADLGAGTGLLSRALQRHHPQLRQRPPLQLDLCPELLARNPLARHPLVDAAAAGGSGPAPGSGRPGGGGALWDLNHGLPDHLGQAALLASSFALQWLDDPALSLRQWCRSLAPGGWLVLAVPTSGSFPQWRQAAALAGVPCTALCLPDADALGRAVQAEGLALQRRLLLRFSRAGQGGQRTLQHLRALGASASRGARLNPGQLRRLLRHWPDGSPLTWEVLLLIGQRPA